MGNKTEQKIIIRASEKTKEAFNTVTGRLKNLSKGAVLATVSMAALGATFSAAEAIAFEKAIDEVSTLLGDTSQIDGMTEAVKQLSEEFGQVPVEQSAALYQIISAGADTSAEAIQNLTAANKLAIGGVTDVETAADGLTSVLNAYGDKVEGVTAVSDSMFVAMRAGKTTIGELSQNIGKVAPIAAQAGVELDELLSATAAVTKGGVNTAEAMTGLRQVIVSVLKPTKEAQDLSKQLGLEFNVAALQSKGFAGFLKNVFDKTQGSTEALSLLFGSVEALTPALQLTGGQAEDFNSILESMKDKAGATEEAFGKMSEGTAFQLNQLKSGISTTADSVGGVLLPQINSLLSVLNSGAQPDGGLGFFTEGLFIAEKSVVALADTMTTLALASAKTVDFLPGTTLLVSEEDIASLEARQEALKEMGAAIETTRMEEIKRLTAARESAAVMRESVVAENEREEAVRTTGITLKDLVLAEKGVATETRYSVRAIDSIISKLKEESETLGFTEEQLQSYRLSLLGADEATIKLAADMAATIAEYEKQQEALEGIESANESALQAQEAYSETLKSEGIALHESMRTSLEIYNGELARNDELLQAGAISAIDYARANEQAAVALDEANDKGEEADRIGEELGLTFASAFEDAVISGESFRDVLGGIFDDIQRIILRKTITEPFGSFISGLFGSAGGGGIVSAVSSIFSGGLGGDAGGGFDMGIGGNGNFLPGRALGGPVTAGSPYIVGEEGPELFIPRQSGGIVPNNRLNNGSQINVTNHIQISGGVNDEGIKPEVLNKITKQLENTMRAVVREEIIDSRRNGGLSSL